MVNKHILQYNFDIQIINYRASSTSDSDEDIKKLSHDEIQKRNEKRNEILHNFVAHYVYR